jgi:hypothetical protein
MHFTFSDAGPPLTFVAQIGAAPTVELESKTADDVPSADDCGSDIDGAADITGREGAKAPDQADGYHDRDSPRRRNALPDAAA